ncbi:MULTISPECIES: hypothetical protein [unclassified Variovorax]|uniref:hypothetical protein n=1 Tax=unclassified Variovorax TaxID=663243 RepID=UPI00116052B9|nr:MULTISPECIES: hypothetical protein [unclassified Variovorax]
MRRIHSSHWRMPTAAVAAAFVCASALASPTSNEYLPCHALAARTLQSCLDASPGAEGTPCWPESRRARDRCYAEVRASHDRHNPRTQAMREAAERAQRERAKP